MKINWNKGLHRLFIIGVVCWFVFILLVYPLKTLSNSREAWSKIYAEETWDAYGIKDEKAREAEIKRIEQKITNTNKEKTIQNFYKTEYFKNFEWFLAFLLLPPIFVYVVFRFFIFLILWIKRGFLKEI